MVTGRPVTLRPAALARVRYAGFAVATIAIGLAVHWRGDALHPVLRDVAGDALWAAMVVWLVAAFAPAMPPAWRGAVAFGCCVAVEFSQLLHFPTLDALRETTAGQLVLGSGFDPRDLVAYAAGVFAAMFVDLTFFPGKSRAYR